MAGLRARGEQLASEAQARAVERLGKHLTTLFGSGAVDLEDMRVLVRGRGLIKRWLIDPSIRFLGGGVR
jgi:hypothetical protein